MSITSTVNSLSTVFMVGKAIWNVYSAITRPTSFSFSSIQKATAYRPLDWSKYAVDDSDLVYIAPNIAEVVKKTNIVDPMGATVEEVTVGYFFDAFIRESHSGSVRITEHPVQGGANISDHAYNLPDRLTIEVFMSDSMETVKASQFTAEKTKSVSAFQKLKELKEKRTLVSVRTRLHYYENMIIENMSTDDDYTTANKLRCTVSLRQIMMARVAETYVALPKRQVKDKKTGGPKQVADPGASPLALIGGQ